MGKPPTFDNLPDAPLVDATKPLAGKVRRADRVGAQSRNPEACVVARAAARVANGSILGIKVGAKFAYVHFGDRIERYVVSMETRNMVKAYDASDYYPTGVPFKLSPPSAANSLGSRAGQKPSPKTGKGAPNLRSKTTPWLRHVNQASG